MGGSSSMNEAAYRILIMKPEGNNSRKAKIMSAVRTEVEWEGLDRIYLEECGQVVGFCDHGNEPSDSVQCG